MRATSVPKVYFSFMLHVYLGQWAHPMSPCSGTQVDAAVPIPLLQVAVAEGKSALLLWSAGLEVTYVLSSHNSLDRMDSMVSHQHKDQSMRAYHVLTSGELRSRTSQPLPIPVFHISLVSTEL